MPRCGQLSRKANGRPCASRPITRGMPSSMALRILPQGTAVLNRAGYQNPRSIPASDCSAGNEESGSMNHPSEYYNHGCPKDGYRVPPGMVSDAVESFNERQYNESVVFTSEPLRVPNRVHIPRGKSIR